MENRRVVLNFLGEFKGLIRSFLFRILISLDFIVFYNTILLIITRLYKIINPLQEWVHFIGFKRNYTIVFLILIRHIDNFTINFSVFIKAVNHV